MVLFNAIYLLAMANILNQLQVHVLHAASRVSYLLPSILVLVLVILLTVFSVVVIVRLTSQTTEVNHANAALQRQVDAACEVSVDASDCGLVDDAKTSFVAGDRSSQSTTPTPAVVSESESEKVHALEARLSFLRDSCRIMFAQKNDLLAQKDDLLAQRDDLLAQRNVDIATLKAQLAATHQMKNDLLAEKDASFKAILEQKNEEAAFIVAQLSAAQQNVATVIAERDGAVAHASTLASELEKTHTNYHDKVASLTRQATHAEGTSATLQTMVEQQKTEINDLSAGLTKIRELYNSDLERFRVQEVRSFR